MRAQAISRSFQILLVEDCPGDVRLVREALKETFVPVQVMVAQDGVEATDYLRQVEAGTAIQPDLILLDLNLPRKNGREVLAEVKGSKTLKQIPIVVMTSSRADEDISQAYSLNANCYITKPNNLTDFIDVIRGIEDFWFMTATLPEHYRRPFPVLPGSARLAS